MGQRLRGPHGPNRSTQSRLDCPVVWGARSNAWISHAFGVPACLHVLHRRSQPLAFRPSSGFARSIGQQRIEAGGWWSVVHQNTESNITLPAPEDGRAVRKDAAAHTTQNKRLNRQIKTKHEQNAGALSAGRTGPKSSWLSGDKQFTYNAHQTHPLQNAVRGRRGLDLSRVGGGMVNVRLSS